MLLVQTMAILVFLFNNVLRTPESTKQLLCNSSTPDARTSLRPPLRRILSTFQLGSHARTHADRPVFPASLEGRGGGEQRNPRLLINWWSNLFERFQIWFARGEFYSKDALVRRFLISAKSSGIMLFRTGWRPFWIWTARAILWPPFLSNADSTRARVVLIITFFSLFFSSFVFQLIRASINYISEYKRGIYTYYEIWSFIDKKRKKIFERRRCYMLRVYNFQRMK